MNQLNIALAIVGLTTLAIALFSNLIKRSPVSEPLLAVAVGAAAGPYASGLLDLAQWGGPMVILEQSARLTIAISIMGIALRLKRDSLRALVRPESWVLTVGMLGMWLISSAIAWLFGFSLWPALLMGAIVTPTDPVVASSVVTGKFAQTHLPVRIRNGLSLESGANDGLAFLFVMLAILAISHSPGEAASRWFLDVLLIGVMAAAAVGVVVGFLSAKLLSMADRKGWVASSSLLGYTIAFSLATLGGAKLFGADALISVFAAGLTFNLCSNRNEEHEEEHIQEAVAKLFTMPMFVIFGLSLPISAWSDAGWYLVALALAILLLRRLPVLAALSPAFNGYYNRQDVGFLGWFGPIGIAAIYYATLAHKHLEDPIFWHVASAIVLGSILLHGVTAAPLTKLYRRSPGPTPPWTGELDNK
mgnify:CR=1 FL=1